MPDLDDHPQATDPQTRDAGAPPPDPEQRESASDAALDVVGAVADVATIGEAVVAGIEGVGAVVGGIAEGVGALLGLFDV